MGNALEIIHQQALLAKQKSNDLETAALLERAAQKLRKNAEKKTVVLDFKAIARSKSARLEKFADSAIVGRINEAKDLLKRSGWTPTTANPNAYSNAKHAGLILQMAGSHFKVTNGSAMVQPTAPITELQTFINVMNKKKKP